MDLVVPSFPPAVHAYQTPPFPRSASSEDANYEQDAPKRTEALNNDKPRAGRHRKSRRRHEIIPKSTRYCQNETIRSWGEGVFPSGYNDTAKTHLNVCISCADYTPLRSFRASSPAPLSMLYSIQLRVLLQDTTCTSYPPPKSHRVIRVRFDIYNPFPSSTALRTPEHVYSS